jgi:quinol monooxygenase YgiN
MVKSLRRRGAGPRMTPPSEGDAGVEERGMWAQLQRVRSGPEHEAELVGVFDQLRAIEQPDSGLLRTMVMRSRSDPGLVFVLVVFESEEKARAREQDPRRLAGLEHIRAAMGGVLDGPPEFFDLDVVLES